MFVTEKANRFLTFARKQSDPIHYLKAMLRCTPDIPTQAAYILAIRCVDSKATIAKDRQAALEYLKRINLTTFMAKSADGCKSMPMPQQSEMLGKDGCRQLKAKREREGYGFTTVKGKGLKNPNTVKPFDLRVFF